MQHLSLHICPRQVMTWQTFVRSTPPCSIALDGMVAGPPRFREKTYHLNFDHHSHVAREATMSTARQVLFAIKGNLIKYMLGRGDKIHVYINDTDQDTALAVWLLENFKLFEGIKNIPDIDRLVELTDRLDVTGGAFPIDLSERFLRQQNWIFQPYSEFRKSGALATADADSMQSNLESVLARITAFMMGHGGETPLDTRANVLYRSPLGFMVTEEIGGTDARSHLYSQGMEAFIAIVARRSDGGTVYSIGRRSPYVPFPVTNLYRRYNAVEPREKSWGGSNMIGGSPRSTGSGLTYTNLIEITENLLSKKKLAS